MEADSYIINGVKYVRQQADSKMEEPQKKAREFWVRENGTTMGSFFSILSFPHPGCIHLREVLPGEVTITREQVLNSMNHFKPSIFDWVGNALFNKFCIELGFKE